MRVRVDRSADAVYLNLTEAAIVESEAVADGIVVDYEAQGGSSASKFSTHPGKRAVLMR